MKSITVTNWLDDSKNLSSMMVGVLDLPRSGAVVESGGATIAGWLISITESKNLKLWIEEAGAAPVEVISNVPRPDVARKMLGTPFEDNDVFGFNTTCSLDNETRLLLDFDGVVIPWKVIHATDINIDAVSALERILTLGYSSSDDMCQAFDLLDMQARQRAIENQLVLNEIIQPSAITATNRVEAGNKPWLIRFARELSSPDFLAQLLLSYQVHGAIDILAPFSDGRSRLIASFFQEGVNYLVFTAGTLRFYVAQFLHTADFVYFPEKGLTLRFEHSHFDQAHLRNLISSIAKNTALAPSQNNGQDALQPELKGLIINGISPYHFFYDTMPALQASYLFGALAQVRHFYGVNGACYFPVERLFKLNATNHQISKEDASNLSKDADGFLLVAGASYKTVAPAAINIMDKSIAECSESVSDTAAIKTIHEALRGRHPIIWVGISAQKRAWLNQESVLKSFIDRLCVEHPNVALVFDGMTANIYYSDLNREQFEADNEIIERLIASLPESIPASNTVGMSSPEKISIAGHIDFFVSNYSTGSMYPARFYGAPGVAHLSNAMLDVVRDIHIHKRTMVVPRKLVTDIPCPENPRLDFISYSLDEAPTVQVMLETLNKSVE